DRRARASRFSPVYERLSVKFLTICALRLIRDEMTASQTSSSIWDETQHYVWLDPNLMHVYESNHISWAQRLVERQGSVSEDVPAIQKGTTVSLPCLDVKESLTRPFRMKMIELQMSRWER